MGARDEQQMTDIEGATSMMGQPMQLARMRQAMRAGFLRTPQMMQGCPIARTSPVTGATVKLGSDGGGLQFVPDSVTVKAGETVQFVNNVGFPHNIVFDEDAVPAGVNTEAISKEDYLNAPGET